MPKYAPTAGQLHAHLEALLLRLPVDWLLGAIAALAALMLLVGSQRLLYLWWYGTNVDSLRARLTDMLKRHQLSRAEDLLKKKRAHAARIAYAALTRLENGPAAIEEVVAGARMVQRLELERGLDMLATLGYAVLGLGTFGTLVGLLHAFAGGPQQIFARLGSALVVGSVAIAVALVDLLLRRTLQQVIRKRLLRADALVRVVLAYAKVRR